MRTQPTPSAASSIASNSYPSRSTPFSRTAATTKSASFDVLGPLLRWFSRSSKRENGFSINSTHTPPTGPNMRCTRAKTESFSSARGLCLPTTTATAARTAKSSVDMGVRSDRSHAQTGRNPLSQTLSHRNQLPNLPRSERATTTTPDPLIRFVLVAVGFLLRNLWLVVRWTVVARPRRGGRDLPTEFTFELVCGWIRDHLSTELGWQYTWETNGVGLPPGYALATA